MILTMTPVPMRYQHLHAAMILLCLLDVKSEYAVTGWALCVMPEVRQDVREWMTGKHCDVIEEVVKLPHLPPCPNSNLSISSLSPFEIVDIFWNEFKLFQNNTCPYHEPSRWHSANVSAGQSYLCHEKYLIPYTLVLG